MSEAICGLLRSSSSRHQPWQLAAALAMGVLCGLLPKLNFTFCAVGCFCLLLPIHVPLAALVCGVVSLVGIAVVPWAGQVGIWSLTHPSLSNFWLALDAYPFVPWLGLHNSVVHGSALLGLGLWLPVFLMTRPIARRFAPPAVVSDTRRDDPDFTHELKPAVAAEYQAPLELSASTVAVEWSTAPQEECQTPNDCQQPARESDTCEQLQQLLESCRSDDANHLSVVQVVERASQIAEFVDELLTACEVDAHASDVACSTSNPAETPIEATHSSPKSLEAFSASAYSSQDVEELSRMRPSPASPIVPFQIFPFGPFTPGTPATREGELLKRHEQHAKPTVATSQVGETAGRPVVGVERQQEALRYLLHHLKAFKDKV